MIIYLIQFLCGLIMITFAVRNFRRGNRTVLGLVCSIGYTAITAYQIIKGMK